MSRLTDLIEPLTERSPSEKLRAALDLHVTGVEMMRCRLRREDPGADDATLEQRVTAWLQSKPMPGVGTWGRSVPLPPWPLP